MDLLKSKQRTIEGLVLPHSTVDGLRRHHPDLTDDEAWLVAAGLRQWYRVAQLAGPRSISMPSRVVDDLWHEHITCTRDYAEFCRRAFGRFLHHQPESGMSSAAAQLNQGFWLRQTWDLARKAEGGSRPLLFELDERLGIEGGKRYVDDCGTPARCSGGFATCYAHLPTAAPSRPRPARSRSGSGRPGLGSSGSGVPDWWGGGSSGSSCGGSSCGSGGGGCGGGS